jgi:hypothetical protein
MLHIARRHPRAELSYPHMQGDDITLSSDGTAVAKRKSGKILTGTPSDPDIRAD